MAHRFLGAGAALLAAGVTLQLLGRRAGSTAEERTSRLPGDDLVAGPQMVMDHAITVAADREEIWPWLTQMGWHLGGWYTPTWVDRLLFPDNWASLDRLDPRLVRDLQVGDVVPDGRPGTAHFRVAQVEPPSDVVMSRGMLRGLKVRAEARRTPRESGRAPLDQDRYLERDRRARA